MKLRSVFFSALLALACSGRLAQADYVFQFTDASGAAKNSFSLNTGDTVDIRVYLLQTGLSTGLSAQGLNSAGVQLNTASPSVANDTATVANSAFDSSATTIGANAKVTEGQISSSAV